MIKEGKKRITFTLKNLTADMFEIISDKTKLTKSELLQQLLFNYTLNFWSDPDAEIERWMNYANQQKK